MTHTIATLCFHSGNPTDYLVLPQVLNALMDSGFKVVSALTLAQHLGAKTLAQLPDKSVVLSFDDGQDMDFVDVHHPTHGAQPSFATILRAANARAVDLGIAFSAHATSFVIASPLTRAEIQEKEMLGYPWMSDRWWQPAIASGLFHIASHSYDHVSESASSVRQRDNLRKDFTQIHTLEDATWQVRKARELIDFIAPNPGSAAGSALFCYPFGHVSRYLHDEYFPNYAAEHGTIGAFTTEPALITADTSVFAIPRFVLGESWHQPGDLAWLKE
jgi:peptidoglycan/xylan/chitin deacetylase (PgdA/CDA1 family)